MSTTNSAWSLQLEISLVTVWHLCYRSLGTLSLLNETPGNLTEFEIACDVGGDEDVGELAVCHDQFGNEVDVPIVGTAILFPWLGTFGVVAVLLEELDNMLIPIYTVDIVGSCTYIF